MSLREWGNRLLGKRPLETILTYRAAFSRSEEGRQVLAWLLENAGFMKTIETDEQVQIHNYGIRLLENMGMTQGVNYKRLVDMLLTLTIPEESIDSGGTNG
ncbi:MAG: hypothetical protein ABIH23_26180 [bacterium]